LRAAKNVSDHASLGVDGAQDGAADAQHRLPVPGDDRFEGLSSHAW